MDLFDGAASERLQREAPLAERMRPRSLKEVVGQDHLLGEACDETGPLGRITESKEIPSMIFWGPPGSGKTTIARLIAEKTGYHFVSFSAVLAGVKDIRSVISEAIERRKYKRQRTILFVDEIHRFNKAQQDAFLSHIEKGTLILLGATTQNPSFEINSALLSRCRMFVLKEIPDEALRVILRNAVADCERGLGAMRLAVEPDALRLLAEQASGDARRALTALEMIAHAAARAQGSGGAAVRIDRETVSKALAAEPLVYDRAGDAHYDVASAFIKSLRGSDPDAALYWLARMIESGEDPRFIARRLVIFAAEDIGNADPQAIQVAVSSFHAFELVGLPEGRLPLAHATTYLATAPKSNASYKGYEAAAKAVRKTGSLPVPLHLRNAVTGLMEELGYGREYKYPHDYPGHHVEETYLPDKVRGRRFYEPGSQGYEEKIRKRLEGWRKKPEEP